MLKINNKIKALNKELTENDTKTIDIEKKLQCEYDKVFDKNKVLKEAIAAVNDSKEYSTNDCGDIVSWIRFDFTDFEHCKEYLLNYLRDGHYIDCDFTNDTLMLSHGNDNLIIQDDTRHDNGVWCNGKCVIDESEYKDDGEVDEDKRKELIEAYMQKTGFYPGVFRIDQHNNISLVKTN